MLTRRRVRTRGSAVLATLAMIAAGLAGLPVAPALADIDPVDSALPRTVTADALPTVQIDGVVWQQVIVGNKVYAVGSFAKARPAGAAPGTNTITRSNILAYDVRTGVLDTGFDPVLNGQATSIAKSPDGSRLYIGGDFTSVDGQTRNRLAAFDTTSGALVAGFAPSIDSRVRAIVATNSTVYIGGSFSRVSKNPRTRLAALSASGDVLAWAPSADDRQVDALAISPVGNKIIIGGRFTTLSGVAALGMGAINATTGAVMPWAANTTIRNYGATAGITSLTVDDDHVYGSGFDFGGVDQFLEGVFSASADTGAITWINDCHGDTHSILAKDGAIYTAGHSHYCGNLGSGGFPQTEPWSFYRGTAMSTQASGTLSRDIHGYPSFTGTPSPTLLNWFPYLDNGVVTGQGQGPWHVTGSGDYLVMGGEFRNVNNSGQQGLVRFAYSEKAPKKQGPRLTWDNFLPTVSSPAAGMVRVAIPANWDRDNATLTYRVFRDTTKSAPVFEKDVTARFWETPVISFVETGLTPGASLRYQVTATDSNGNVATSNWVTTTVSSQGTLSDYAVSVLNGGAQHYWRLGETSGSTVADLAGGSDAKTSGFGITRNVTGALSNDANSATRFDGSRSSFAASQSPEAGPNTFSAEAWVNTTSSTGGKILGFGNAKTGSSSSYDRHLYMDNQGRAVFGVYPGSPETITSATGLNDGRWHYLVASLGSDGMKLSVDGELVSANPAVRSAQGYSGYWRIGGDSLGGWPFSPARSYFTGDIDEVAISAAVLSAQQIARRYSLGSGVQVLNINPVAAFTSDAAGLTVTFDGTTSVDPDGDIASYAWTFGDGGTSAVAKPSHTYGAAGTFTAKLTVTDDRGGTHSVTHPVTVAPIPNAAPEARFTSSAVGLEASLDASSSTDSDGSIASFAWTFGDGSNGTGVKPSHTYAAAGTYSVTLTVTDNDGESSSVTHSVVMTNPPVDPDAVIVAKDAFARTASNGWGSADLGGAWTRSGTAANLSVAGGVGTLHAPSSNSGVGVRLAGVSETRAVTSADVSFDKAPAGSGTYLAVAGRQVGGNDYRAKLRMLSGGAVTVQVVRSVGSEVVIKGAVTVPGVDYRAGDKLRVKVEVTGTSPTMIRAKVWSVGDTEPGAWLTTVDDSTASLQVAGGAGFYLWNASSVTNAPTTVSVDNFSVEAQQ